MTITREFKLCLNAGTASAPFINVNQYDEGEEWYFSLYHEDGSSYTPSSGAIIGLKADNNAILNAGTVVAGKVLITETQQMTAAAGRAIYELLIDGETHGTANFIVNVERRPSDDAEFSDSDLSLLQEAIDVAEVINEILDEGGDPSEIITENVNAWLDNHPEATTTVEDGAITAPKINNSLWDKLLVSEEASGAVASFEDGADDVPVSSLKVALEPIQTGTGDPSPSNVRPIIAANEKNLFNESLFETYTETIIYTSYSVANGTYIMSGDLPFDANIANVFFLTGSVTTGANTTNNGVYLNRPITLTVTDGHYTVAYRSTGSNTKNPKDYHFQIERGSSASAYQPYQGIMVERCGKNVMPFPYYDSTITRQGVTFTVNGDGTLTLSGTATGNAFFNYSSGLNTPFQLSAGTYTKIVPTQSGLQFDIYKLDNTALSAGNNATFTLAETTLCYAYLRVASGTSFATPTTVYPQIERGSEATEYEPYAGNTYPYTLGQSVYGGTVDLATGVLTVTHVYYQFAFSTPTSKDSQNRWVMGTALPNVSSALFAKMWDATIHATGYGFVSDSLQIHLENAEVASASTCAFYGHGSSCEYRVRVPDTYTAAEAKAIADANHIVYPIEPQTIQLTPTQINTLLGYNNISSTGTVEVIYHADTKLYIDKKIGELS